MHRIAFALAAAAFSLAPAQAADVSTIGCISGKISAELRGKIGADYAARLGDPSRTMDVTLDDQVIAFGQACRSQYGWSEVAMNSAIAWTRAGIALPVTEKFARARGIDVDKVWKIWNASPVSTLGHQVQDSDLSTLGTALQNAGVFRNPGDPAIIGKLIAYKNVTDFARKDFING